MTNSVSSKHILTSILKPLETLKDPDQPLDASSTTTTHSSHHVLLAKLPEVSQQQAKSVLLTLHFLFPHELLPALDLIDRRLITLLSVIATTPDTQGDSLSVTKSSSIKVFYVQSASAAPSAQTRGRFRNALSKTNQFYEARLDEWNCTCAAFAYSALRLLMKDLRSCAHPENETEVGALSARISRPTKQESRAEAESIENLDWLFGGSTTKDDTTIPICKHILAVTLVKSAPGLFGKGLVSRDVSKEEMAAWAAGWGER